MEIADIADRIESALHLEMQLKATKEQGKELYMYVGGKYLDRQIRIAEARKKRNEKRFDKIIGLCELTSN